MPIPFLSGYRDREEQIRRQERGDLQNAGTLQGMLAKMQAKEKEQAFRGELAALGPNPSQESLAGIAAKYSPAADILKSQTSSLDRKATLESANVNRADSREQRLAELTQRGEQEIARVREAAAQNRITREDADRREAAMRENLTRLAASLRPAPAEQAPVAVIGPDGKPVLVSRADAIGRTPASATAEKMLPGPLQKQLTEAAELADATTRFKTTFKDTYGGKTITGDLGNVYGRIAGDDTGQSQWWQDYELHQSQIRNKLFGSALTAPEIEAWNKSAINPRMHPGQIKLNLSRRDQLEQRAIDRLIKGATAGRYNKEQIEAFTGRGADGPPPTAPAATGNTRLKFDSQGNPAP